MEISRSLVIKSLAWKFLEKMGTRGISFVISVVLARLLAPHEYGLIAMISIFFAISGTLIEGGFGSALIQKKNATNIDFSTIFYVSLSSAFLLYSILYICAPLIASFYNQPILSTIVRVSGLSLFLGAINSVQGAYLSKNMMFRKSFLCNIISTVLSGIIGITMAYKGYGVWALVSQSLFAGVFNTLYMWFAIGWRPQLVFSFQSLKELFGFGSKILITSLIISLFKNIRGLVIGKMYAPAMLAFFEKGKSMPNLIISNLSSTIQGILFPVLSNSQDDKAKVKSILKRSIKTSALLVFPCITLLFVTARPLVILLFTEKWLPTVPFLQIFCLAYIILPIQSANMQVVQSLGRSDLTLKIETIKKILELIIMVISFTISVEAVAWGIVIYNYVCLFINLYPNRKLIKYSYHEQISDILPNLIAAFCMGLFVYFLIYLPLSSFVIIVLQVIGGLLFYSAICYVFKIESFVYIYNIIKSHR